MVNVQKMREARFFKNLTQADVADRVGISQAQYNKIERGKQDGSVSTLRAIADALNLDLALIMKDGNPTQPSPRRHKIAARGTGAARKEAVNE